MGALAGRRAAELAGGNRQHHLPRALLERLNGFDEQIEGPGGEDTDLWLRAEDAGARLIAVREARVLHAVHPMALGQYLRSLVRWADLPAVVACASALDDARKRGDLLLAAFARLREQRPEARLVPARPRGGALAAALEAPGVELVDVDGEDELVRRYSAASVTVLAAEAEAFGLVLVESLACGTPAVAGTDGAGQPDAASRSPTPNWPPSTCTPTTSTANGTTSSNHEFIH